MRSELQREADSIDCGLYRIITRVERLYAEAERRRDRDLMPILRAALVGLRSARPPIRRLMSEVDRALTV